MKKMHWVLALAAGFVGGALSHFLAAPAVHAESRPAPVAEVRAHSFVLVNGQGRVLGTFAADPGGLPSIRLYDPNGRELWSAEGPTLRASTGR